MYRELSGVESLLNGGKQGTAKSSSSSSSTPAPLQLPSLIGDLVDHFLNAAAASNAASSLNKRSTSSKKRSRKAVAAALSNSSASAHPSAIAAAGRGMNPYKVRIDPPKSTRAEPKNQQPPPKRRRQKGKGGSSSKSTSFLKERAMQKKSVGDAESPRSSAMALPLPSTGRVRRQAMFQRRSVRKAKAFLKQFVLRRSSGETSGASSCILKKLWRHRGRSCRGPVRFGRGGQGRRHREFFLRAIGKTFARARHAALLSLDKTLSTFHGGNDGLHPVTALQAARAKYMSLFPLFGLRVRLVHVDASWSRETAENNNKNEGRGGRRRRFMELLRRRGLPGVVVHDSSNVVGVVVCGAGGVASVAKTFPGAPQVALPPASFTGWVACASEGLPGKTFPYIL